MKRVVALVLALGLLAAPVSSSLAASAPAAASAPSRRATTAASGVVVSSDAIASQVGIDVLKDGGNAADAAIAVSFALAVVYPRAGNLGGGGFLVYRDAGTKASAIIDFRETAPAAATPRMYLDAKGEVVPRLSTEGYLAVATPGTVAGMELAHKKYGLLPWKRLLRPAIRLAQRGFRITGAFSEGMEEEFAVLARYPTSAAIFLPGGAPPLEGSVFKQPDLARTLKRISEQGADGFYRGPVAAAIAADVKAHGGILGVDDLAAYRARVRRPLEGTYRDLRLLVPPPPSSGGVLLLEILNMLEPQQLVRQAPLSLPLVHLMAETEKRAYSDRASLLGDPDFFDVPVASLVSKQYALSRAAGISLDQATPASEVKPGLPVPAQGAPAPAPAPPAEAAPPREPGHTTHYAVVDRWRNVAAVTTTLNSYYGSKAVATGTGVVLNNEMDDFSIKPGTPNLYGLVGGVANEIRPGKRPLSSMTPTIVLKSDRPYLVLGTPGGSTIITSVLQVFLDVVEHGMGLEAAVKAPRVHHQWLPDKIQIEEGALPADVQDALTRMGHTVALYKSSTGKVSPIGDFQAIRIDPQSGALEGVSDPRGTGEPRGY
jgi:gamma-glutamyltranspeptidase/glutathione hydrolase